LKILSAGLLGAYAGQRSAPLLAGEVPWLERVVQGPKTVPPADRGFFEPLLIDSEGRPITSVDQWNARREALKEAWYRFLGPMPAPGGPLNVKLLHEDRDAGCLRQLLEYESEPGERVPGYLLSPLDPPAKKLPGLVALHPTTDDTIEEIAGLKGREGRDHGVTLARRGFVVFCPRNFLWKNAESYEKSAARFRQGHPQTLGMRKMLFDAQRAIDVLESLPDVDRRRIGCVGHSLGGKEVLYLAAFDERIQAAVGSELGMGFTFTNWHDPWYLSRAIHEPDFKLNHHQLVALIAPRPFLLLAGETGAGSVADGDRSWPYLEAAHPVCRLYGRPVRLGMYNHGEGHTVSARSFEMLAEWLETYLA